MTSPDQMSSCRVLAFGAYLKNRACLIDGGRTHWSDLHGDLGDPLACQLLAESIKKLTLSASGSLDLLVHDLHPDFYSTVLATRLAQTLKVPSVAVQHHHAHIASVMAEHNLQGPVLGIALDGAGWGDDQTIWGGELLLVEGTNAHRIGHLRQLALPGGDLAATQPWRMVASALNLLGRGGEIGARLSPSLGAQKVESVKLMLDNCINAPLTSSAGRWFDVAAGLLGLCETQKFEAEAAQLLEVAAKRWLDIHPNTCSTGLAFVTNEMILDLGNVVEQLLDVPESLIDQAAARFHLDLVDGIVKWVIKALDIKRNINRICLSGGCFYNLILKERLKVELEALNLNVFISGAFGGDCGDAGLALGQAWIGTEFLKEFQKETLVCA